MTVQLREDSQTTEQGMADAIASLRSLLNEAIRGKEEVVELVLACLLARGHLLLEDLPGLGKTTLARTLAHAVGGLYTRVQCTPDLMPSDITGFNMFNQKTREFEFCEGPVFANVLLADEINRATPRTQTSSKPKSLNASSKREWRSRKPTAGLSRRLKTLTPTPSSWGKPRGFHSGLSRGVDLTRDSGSSELGSMMEDIPPRSGTCPQASFLAAARQRVFLSASRVRRGRRAAGFLANRLEFVVFSRTCPIPGGAVLGRQPA